MYVTFRPLVVWPHKPTANRRRALFKTSYPRTLYLLEREIEALGGKDVTMGVGLSETDIRLDGQPRANARAMGHPGVEITFHTPAGARSFSSDEFDDWQDNVRAIALSLEALRAVERYGVSKGRQYAGFALLAAGPSQAELGERLVARYGSIKEALRHTHPDTGDTDVTPNDYQAVLAYRKAQDDG